MTAAERVLGVLVAHRAKRGIRDMFTHCEFGWVSSAQADGWYQHAGHQAEQIISAQRRGRKKAAS